MNSTIDSNVDLLLNIIDLSIPKKSDESKHILSIVREYVMETYKKTIHTSCITSSTVYNKDIEAYEKFLQIRGNIKSIRKIYHIFDRETFVYNASEFMFFCEIVKISTEISYMNIYLSKIYIS